MSKVENAKNQFYSLLNDRIKNGLVKEVSKIQYYDSGFYELCKSYADIGLNSSKKLAEDNYTIEACFHDSDFNKTVDETKQYIDIHDIKDIDDFFDAIRSMHSYAIDTDDTRAKRGICWKNSNNNDPRLGMYIVFSQLPDDIFDEIVVAVKQVLNN